MENENNEDILETMDDPEEMEENDIDELEPSELEDELGYKPIHNHLDRHSYIINQGENAEKNRVTRENKKNNYKQTNNVNDLGDSKKTLNKKNTRNAIEGQKNSEGTGKLVKYAIKKIPAWVWVLFGGILILVILLFVLFGTVSSVPEEEKVVYRYDPDCEIFSIKYTYLTRKEFIEGAKNHVWKDSTGEFKKNLGLIYDESVKRNINPEIVVVRAFNEGFVPGATHHNFWAIGCGNTTNCKESGHQYSNFKEGLNAFLDIVEGSKDVISFMTGYGYIGDYWYNPGGSGLGGCYYFESLKPFLSAQRIAEIAPHCLDVEKYPGVACPKTNDTNVTNSSGEIENKYNINFNLSVNYSHNYTINNIRKENINGFDSGKGPINDFEEEEPAPLELDCLPTTEEDNRAKGKSSAYRMAYTRQMIWGLPVDDCLKELPTCQNYAQGDPRWGGMPLGNSTATVAKYGCAVTSLATGMVCSDLELNVEEFNPAVLVSAFNANKCFDSRGQIYWNCSALREIAPSLKFVTASRVRGSLMDIKYQIRKYDPNNHIILAHFKNADTYSHYVVFYLEKDNLHYAARDPGTGSITIQKYNEIDQLVVYEYEPKNGNYDSEISTSSSNNTILNQPLNKLLTAKEYLELNEKLRSEVEKVGIGTRSAVVAAGTIPLEYLSKNFNVVLPYTWAGGHYDNIPNRETGENVNTPVNSFYGVDPNWGTKIIASHNTVNYTNFGPDCSAWANWIYLNAGIDMPASTAKDFSGYGTNYAMDGSYIGKVGDAIVRNDGGHVMVIVGVDTNSRVYYVSQALGGAYGTIISKVDFEDSNQKIVDMGDYLSNHINSNYNEDFRNGVKDY